MMNDGFEYMKEAIVTDLALAIINDYQMSIADALDVLYNSDTFAKLNNLQTGLYFQSSPYVYSYLKQEINTGKMG